MEWLIAQTPLQDANLWEIVLGGGGALTTVILFLYGFHAEWWVSGKVYRRRIDEIADNKTEMKEVRDELTQVRQSKDEELAHLRNKIEEQIIPLVVRSTDLLARLMGSHRRHNDDS
jgi:hypothetical protein